jgi:hypothetical protein
MLAPIGVVMLFVSVVWCGASLLLPQLFAPLGQTFCAPGERYAAEVVTTETATSFGVGTSYVCINAQGEARSIRGEMTRSTTQVFLALLFGGMVLVAAGAGRYMHSQGEDGPNVTRKKKKKNDIEPDALTTALTQLEQARAVNLISEEEYLMLRQEILDKLV